MACDASRLRCGGTCSTPPPLIGSRAIGPPRVVSHASQDRRAMPDDGDFPEEAAPEVVAAGAADPEAEALPAEEHSWEPLPEPPPPAPKPARKAAPRKAAAKKTTPRKAAPRK